MVAGTINFPRTRTLCLPQVLPLLGSSWGTVLLRWAGSGGTVVINPTAMYVPAPKIFKDDQGSRSFLQTLEHWPRLAPYAPNAAPLRSEIGLEKGKFEKVGFKKSKNI